MKKVKCQICKKNESVGVGWFYVWYGKQTDKVCDDCNKMWYHLAYIALGEAEKDIKKAGMKIIQSKDKYGSIRVYVDSFTDKQEIQLKELGVKYKTKYPMFDFMLG